METLKTITGNIAVHAVQLIILGAEIQQNDVLHTTNKSVGELAESFGFTVNAIDGVRGYSAYIFLS